MASRLKAVGPPTIWSTAPATGPTQSARTAGAQTLANSVEPGGHHHPAAVDDRHVIGDLIDVGQLMGREQHGGAPVRGMANQRLQHLFGRRRVEPGGRLVEHQQIGAAAERQQ